MVCPLLFSLLTAASQIVGVVAAGALSGEKELQLGADIAGSATNYNYLGHEQLARAAREINSCKSTECVSDAQIKYLQISAEQDAKAFLDCASNAETCKAHSAEVANAKLKLDAIYNELGDGIDDFQKKETLQVLINQNHDVQEMLAMATTGRQAEGALIKLQTTLGLSDKQVADIKEAMITGAVGGPMGAAAFFKIKSILASSAAKKRAALNVASDNGSSKATGGAVDRATTGIEWGKGIQGQGMPWEDYLGTQLPAGSRLPPNFKTFDFFDRMTGVATSAKTLDTATAAKMASPSQVYSSLKGNIDAAAGFTEYGLKDVTVSSSQITSRELQVAVPKATTSAQWDQINRVIEYGQSKGVTVKITKVY